MANLQDIRRRIKSVKNTAQITKAMQLVASAKMKKAQDQAMAGREYAEALSRVLIDLKAAPGDKAHALLDQREGKKELMLVISTDKGLCGGLNANLLKKLRAEAGDETDYVTVGKKLRMQIAKAGGNVIADWSVGDPVPFNDAKPIAKFITEKFLSGDYDRVTVAFNKFVSTLTQHPTVAQVLPISSSIVEDSESSDEDANQGEARDFIFEPDAKEVLNKLLPLYINYEFYQMLLEARASEHSARMVAMKAATDNANSVVKELTLEYNKLRQAAITAELLEITTAMKAME